MVSLSIPARRRAHHTRLITGVKAALRRGDSAAIARTLRRHSRAAGLPSRISRVVGEVVEGRLRDTISHVHASDTLRDLAHTTPTHTLHADTWLTLENLARSIGCFHASHPFTQHALTRILHQPVRTDYDTTRHFTAHLHTRNLDGAIHAYTTKRPTRHTEHFWKDAGHYLWLWSQHHHGTPHWSPDTTWTTLLAGTHTTILGPAPTSHTPPPHPTHIARVIMQGVLSWDPSRDVFGGVTDLAYANRETRNWLRDTSQWDTLARFKQVSFRVEWSREQWQALGVMNARPAHDPRRLMLSGSSPNMIPLMVWDVLRVPDTRVTVAGTTFFASPVAYSASNRRFKHTVGKDTDEIGSTGSLFERCPTFARHNVVDNLTLVANLVQAGAISMDKEGTEVVSWDVLHYLGVLDTLYGVERK